MLIEVPAVVVGRGPAPLTVAKMLAGQAIPCLLAGHEPAGNVAPVPLGDAAIATLKQHRVYDVLLPYVGRGPSPAMSSDDYEDVLKHHCVADVNVTVYDAVAVVERRSDRAGVVEAVLTDGRSRWDLRARRLVDGDSLPVALPEAIVAAATLVNEMVFDLAHP